MSYLVMLLGLLFAWLAGALMLLAYILHRMMKNKEWDDSNITNALRLLSHVCLHPEDFGRMFYLQEVSPETKGATPAQVGNSSIVYLKRPFWYVSKDELSEVVETRP